MSFGDYRKKKKITTTEDGASKNLPVEVRRNICNLKIKTDGSPDKRRNFFLNFMQFTAMPQLL